MEVEGFKKITSLGLVRAQKQLFGKLCIALCGIFIKDTKSNNNLYGD